MKTIRTKARLTVVAHGIDVDAFLFESLQPAVSISVTVTHTSPAHETLVGLQGHDFYVDLTPCRPIEVGASHLTAILATTLPPSSLDEVNYKLA
jgi:hypothetical protein